MRSALPAIVVLSALCAPAVYGVQYSGTVRAADQFIPGAAVTAIQGDKRVSAFTDENGRYTLELSPGEWDIRVEMFEFSSASEHVTSAVLPLRRDWTLEMPKLADRLKAAGVTTPNRGQFGRGGGGRGRSGVAAGSATPGGGRVFQSAAVRATPEGQQAVESPELAVAANESADGDESFLV
ncbi:MAG TPA: carboxypeptidase-like regulatory domain-containing protein, partial [Bryobacteraceae bacterium]|nr:carboxypeptidase-like regulatory domain-containing protein [Bryobacteraceae bacterium]